jgi:type I restriction enzyme M protein
MLVEIDAAGTEDFCPEDEAVEFDLLTGEVYKPTEKERLLQRMIMVMAGEYRYPLEVMERDVPVKLKINDKQRTHKVDLVIFRPDAPHTMDNAERLVVVQAPNTKVNDAKRGVELLKDLLDAVPQCKFGLWTNGRDVSYLRKRQGPLVSEFTELSDFPGNGESMDDLNRPDRRFQRVAVTEDLRDTVLRCHDYLYGNQAMTGPRAFGELVKLIFAKIYDEQQLRRSTSYRRRFWVGSTEWSEQAGQVAIAERIKSLFEDVKNDDRLRDAFRPGDEIELQPRQLAWIARELGRYQFLDTEVDVKGMAYEAMVATTMKRERGQFFTPRNVVDAMVEVLAPQPGERVLDPACGSGRFLVACLDRFRWRRAEEMGPASPTQLRARRNSQPVLDEASKYAESCLFGVDLDPELQRAAKMNMLINNDGHGNLFVANSLEISRSGLAEESIAGAEHLAFESFDLVLTNPPFGAKIPVDDPAILRGLDLGYHWQKTPQGWMKTGRTKSKMPPEILFIERCWQWLKPGGRMGIVLPDGILGNPDNESIRHWILTHARVLASIDLPVEAFLPQVGVQASLLFLQKKSLAEINAGADGDYPIFMGVAEYVGHDRRGVPVHRRDADGFELYEEIEENFTVLKDGQLTTEVRKRRQRVVADDLPDVARHYRNWHETGRDPEPSFAGEPQ